MTYEFLFQAFSPDGTIRCVQLPQPSGSSPNATIEITGASKEAWITWVGDTNFNQDAGNATSSYSFRGPDPHDSLLALLTDSSSTPSFATILDEHVTDYQSVTTKPFALDLGQAPDLDTPTDILMSKYQIDAINNQAGNVYIEWLTFNFGRYLLSSSARGTLPTNLQGKWGDGFSQAWGAGLFIRFAFSS
jgi:alpha-L-fucosidase 2